MTRTSSIALALQELEYAFHRMSGDRGEPVVVRREFIQFVQFTKKLIDYSRKEFKAQTGQTWKVESFSGWTPVTTLFKELRRIDTHESPVNIKVRETLFFPVGALPEGVGGFPPSIAVTGVRELTDAFAETVPEGLRLVPCDLITGEPIVGQSYEATARQYAYHLEPRTDKLAALLEAAKTDDVHLLCGQCLAVFRDYVRFFSESLARPPATNQRGAG
jgi:hypothetical protein